VSTQQSEARYSHLYREKRTWLRRTSWYRNQETSRGKRAEKGRKQRRERWQNERHSISALEKVFPGV
jgi:hypothetical protein